MSKENKDISNLGKYLSQEKFSEIKNIGIFLHDYPDPDAMASGMAMASIAEKYGYISNIYYGGEINYTQNKAMVQILGINLIKIEDIKEDTESLKAHRNFLEKAIIAVVDTSYWCDQNCKGPLDIFPKNEYKDKIPEILIDHHGQAPVGNDLIINKQYGSCSTIFVELLKEEGLIPDKVLSTALYYGLMSDTEDLNRVEITKDQDHEAQAYLKSLIDFQYYLRIVNCKKPRILMHLEGRAKNEFIRERGNCTVAGVGFIKSGHSGAVSEIANNILSTYQEVENVVVIGISDEGIGKEKKIIASLRTSGDVLDSDDFMKKIFGKKCAGGRKGAAAASKVIEEVLSNLIDNMSSKENSDILLNYIFKEIFDLYSGKIISELQVST